MRFRAALWALRIRACLELSFTDLDITYLLHDGEPPQGYVQSDFDKVRVMERYLSEGSDPRNFRQALDGFLPQGSKAWKSRRTWRSGKGIDLVEQFVKWDSRCKPARDEFHHPIWAVLTAPCRPSRAELIRLRGVLLRLCGLAKLDELQLSLAKAICGPTFLTGEGDLGRIEQGARALSSLPSLHALLALAVEYRLALDRFRPEEAVLYRDSFFVAADLFIESVGDAYIGRGISALLMLRLMRDDWEPRGPERWRNSKLKKTGSLRDLQKLDWWDLLLSMISSPSKQGSALSSVPAPSNPIIQASSELDWYVFNLDRLMVAHAMELNETEGFDEIYGDDRATRLQILQRARMALAGTPGVSSDRTSVKLLPRVES